MFYNTFIKLCNSINKKPSAVATELGINKSNVSNWKNNGYTPRGDALQKIADYFGVSADYLLTGEQKSSPSTAKGEEIGFDDFTYAMQNETKELTDADRELLLSMAKQLKEARKQRDGKGKDR